MVDDMHANMGGTELKLAIQAVLEARDLSRPTSIFVLTDGDVIITPLICPGTS